LPPVRSLVTAEIASVRRRIRVLLGAVTIGGALASIPVAALAADLRRGSDVTVGSGETVNDDLYAVGGTITVNGNVNGNVIVAGGTVTIAGAVSRDVMVAGANLTISGHVGGSVRAAGGTLTVTGPVAGDVVIAGGTVDIGSAATNGRDLVVAGGNATAAGPIRRNGAEGSQKINL